MSFQKLNDLKGQVAIVTGANGGIGRAICKRLVELGAVVYGITRSRQEELQEFLNSLGSKNRALLCDVTDFSDLNKISAEISSCDILVIAAGKSKIVQHENLYELTETDFNELIKNNLTSVFLTIKAFLPAMKLSNNALVINISSASSLRGGGSNIAYAAAKAGVDSLTKNLAIAFAPNIRFISLNPSAVDTGFVPVDEERLRQIGKNTPLKRIATVEDVANAVESFSTTLRFSTGICFTIDGGRII